MRPAVAALLSTVLSILAAVSFVACGNSDTGGSATTQTPTSTTTTTTTKKPATTTTTASPRAGAIAASDGSFTVNLPKDWRSEPAQGSLIQLIGDDGANLAVTVNGAGVRGPTTKDSAETGEKNLINNLKATIDPGGIESSTVDGEPAWRFTYTVPAASFQQAHDTRGRSLYVRHRDIEYLVTFSSTPETFGGDVANYESIMQSWKWAD